MILTMTRNRALAIMWATNPTALALGDRICGYLDGNDAVVSLLLEGADAEVAAHALMDTDLLTEWERDDYLGKGHGMNDCPMCGEPVAYGDDERMEDADGSWWHAPCWGENLDDDWFPLAREDESLAVCAGAEATG